MRHIALLALAVTLIGCASPTAAPGVRPAMCGWLTPYSAEFQTQAAEELAALAQGAALRVLIEDYGVLRARIRAACGER